MYVRGRSRYPFRTHRQPCSSHGRPEAIGGATFVGGVGMSARVKRKGIRRKPSDAKKHLNGFKDLRDFICSSSRRRVYVLIETNWILFKKRIRGTGAGKPPRPENASSRSSFAPRGPATLCNRLSVLGSIIVIILESRCKTRVRHNRTLPLLPSPRSRSFRCDRKRSCIPQHGALS